MKRFIFTLLSALTSLVLAGDHSPSGVSGVDLSKAAYACSTFVVQSEHSDSDDVDYHVNEYHLPSLHFTYPAHQYDVHEKALIEALYGYHTRAPPVSA